MRKGDKGDKIGGEIMAELVATNIIASQPTTYSKTDRLRNFTTSLTLFTILKSGNILNENFVFTSITLS